MWLGRLGGWPQWAAMVRAAGRWPAARQTVSVTLGHTRHTSVLASLTSSSRPFVTGRRTPRPLRCLQHGQVLSLLGYKLITAFTAARCSLLTSLAHNGPLDWEPPWLPGVALQVLYRTPRLAALTQRRAILPERRYSPQPRASWLCTPKPTPTQKNPRLQQTLSMQTRLRNIEGNFVWRSVVLRAVVGGCTSVGCAQRQDAAPPRLHPWPPSTMILLNLSFLAKHT